MGQEQLDILKFCAQREFSGARVYCANVDDVLQAKERTGAFVPEDLKQSQIWRQAGDRHRSLAGRVLVRQALSQCVQGRLGPELWQFEIGENGKPYVSSEQPRLQFNVSHSDRAVAVVVSSDRDVGIDIEKNSDQEPIFDVLSEAEAKGLSAVSLADQSQHFLRLWTAKEACAKALGAGAGIDFAAIEIDIERDRASYSPSPIGEPKIFRLDCAKISVAGEDYWLSAAVMVDEF